MNDGSPRPADVKILLPGIGSAWAIFDRSTGIAELRWLLVDYQQRGTGHGTRLLAEMERSLAEEGAHAIHLVADPIDASNVDAGSVGRLIEWYERRGYLHQGDQRLVKRLGERTATMAS